MAKIEFDVSAMKDALSLLGRVVVKRTPKPALACVCVVTSESGVTLRATNLEQYVQTELLRVDVVEAGDPFLIPFERFQQILRTVNTSNAPTMSMTHNSGQVFIQSPGRKYKLETVSAEHYPAPMVTPNEYPMSINAADLIGMLVKAEHAMSKESSRYAINGVLFEADGNKATVVATDSRRMVHTTSKMTGSMEKGVVLPATAIKLILSAINSESGEVNICIKDGQATFQYDGGTIYTCLHEGNFPPYKDVIPKDFDRSARLDCEKFIDATQAAQILTSDESKGVRFKFEDGNLTLSSRATESGEASIECEVGMYTGEAIEIGANPAYLLEAVRVLKDDEFELHMKAPNKPIKVQAENYLAVIMPVNLQ